MATTIKEIDKFIEDLPRHEELAKKIATYINSNDNYTLAQVGAIIDEFYGHSCGLSIADDIKCLF